MKSPAGCYTGFFLSFTLFVSLQLISGIKASQRKRSQARTLREKKKSRGNQSPVLSLLLAACAVCLGAWRGWWGAGGWLQLLQAGRVLEVPFV